MVSRKARAGIAAAGLLLCWRPARPAGGAAGPLLPENGMLDSGTSSAPLRLIAHPHLERGGYHLDRFDACLDGELITTSRQPLLDGARALLARGFDPDAMLTIRLASSAADSFRPKPIREWARWTITERDRDGLRRERWRSPGNAASSTRDAHQTATTPHRGENLCQPATALPDSSMWEAKRRRAGAGSRTVMV